MAGRTLALSVLVSLVDRLTGPLAGLRRRFEGFLALGKRIGILGGALAAISFAAPLQSAAAFDASIRDIGITAGYSGAALERMIDTTSSRYEQLALKVGQFSSKLGDGAQRLVAAGMDQGLIDRLMPTIGKVATAANAEVADIAATAFALSDALKVPADQMETALAGLVTAGKLGRFELNNMAREFPSLTAQMEKLKIEGMEAVATLGAGLQVAMKGASDPAQAANNFRNFLSKIASPETVKRFKDAGVDITAVMQDAAAKGINPVEAVVQKITKLVGISDKEVSRVYAKAKAGGASDLQALEKVREQIKKIGGAAKLGNLFGDQQVLDFLLPMLANPDLYKEIRDAIRASSTEIIETDFQSQMAGLGKQMEWFGEVAEQAMRRVGRAFGENLPLARVAVETLLAGVAWLDQALPGSVDTVLAAAGAGLMLVTALGAIGIAAPIVAAGFGVIAAALGLIVSPIGIVIAALAGAAAVIVDDWENFAPFFTRMWRSVRGVWRDLRQWIRALWVGDFATAGRAIRQAAAGVGDVLAALGGAAGHFARLWAQAFDRTFGTNVEAWGDALGGVVRGVYETIKGLESDMLAWATAVAQGDWSAAAAAVESMGTRITTALRPVGEWLDKITGYDVSGTVRAWAAALGEFGAKAAAAFADPAKAWADFKAAILAFEPVRAALEAIGSAFAALRDAGVGAIQAIKNVWDSLVSAISGFKMPEIFGGGAASPAAPATPGSGGAGSSGGGAGGGGGGGDGGLWDGEGWTPQKQGALPSDGTKSFAQWSPGKGFAPAPRAQNTNVGGKIVVAAAEGATIKNVQSDNPAIPLVADRGAVVGRA